MDPFGCVTLAGCAMKVYKTLFLTKDTVFTTKNAYLNQYKAYSSPSIQWLEYIKASKNVDVHHTLNHGEVRFGPYHVDGYQEFNDDRIALEFLGVSGTVVTVVLILTNQIRVKNTFFRCTQKTV